jgi:hypothetical protein
MTEYTKRTVAKEQLVTAIRLFFCEVCPCSVHTLVSASLGILQDILRNEKKDYLLNIEREIKPERIAEWRALMRKQANFFKHADRDPAGALKLNEGQTEFQLIEAVNAFATLYGKKTYSMMVYQLWFASSHPGFFDGRGWYKLKAKLEEIGFETNRFGKREACYMINSMKGNDPELDNAA